MFELSNGFCMGGVSKGKINLVELSNVRVKGQSSYRMLTVDRKSDQRELDTEGSEVNKVKQEIRKYLN